jgi:hypothetical protein
MTNVFFFQTQQIPDDTILFDEFKQQNIFYSYFQVDQNYYLFFYSQKSIDIHFLYQFVDVIQELDSKQRKIRSLRGFFLYALEIIENAQDYEILSTNLQPFVWRKVKNIIRQNKKAALQEFLFGKNEDEENISVNRGSSLSFEEMEKKIQNLQNQVNSLQDRIRDLETTLFDLTTSHGASFEVNSKYALSDCETKVTGMESKSISDPPKIDFQPLSKSEEYNLSLNQEKALNEPNFITLGKISEEEKIEIIKLGFQLNQEGKISLKKYYEGTGESSLFQLKGYSIKYESIRRTKLYQSLKE